MNSDEYIKKCLINCEAPIKRDFLDLSYESNSPNKTNNNLIINIENKSVSKKRNRGTFKSNERMENLNYISKLKNNNLCGLLATIGECNLKENCNKDHDIENYIKNKEKEEEENRLINKDNIELIQKSCPLFDNYGLCHLGLNCEYGLNHFDKNKMSNINNKGERVNELILDNFYKKYEYNIMDNKIRNDLRKKVINFYDTERFSELYNELSISNKKYINNKIKKSIYNPLLKKEIIKDDEIEEIDDKYKLDKKNIVGVIDGDNKIKKNDFFRNKLILAPLTTVGNLPFRRLCVKYGADITVSEMVLCNEILAGKPSELALLKRSPDEKYFGIQLAGGNKNTVIKTGEFINKYCEFDFLDINAACPLKSLHDKGAGSILVDRVSELSYMIKGLKYITNKLVTVKLRMSHSGSPINKNLLNKDYYEDYNNWSVIYKNMSTHKILNDLYDSGIDAITIHGRTSFQRYTKEADWDYVKYCSLLNMKNYKDRIIKKYEFDNNISDIYCPSIIGCGDIINYQDYIRHINNDYVDSIMIGRGALLKPWIFTEIKENRNWDISSNERFDILKEYVNFGLQHWGTDKKGIATTRRFLLEFLSFYHRYIPIGILEQPLHSQNFNWRVPRYFGRNDLETLLSSNNSSDWIKITEMLLGKVSDDFVFIPKHKANSSN